MLALTANLPVCYSVSTPIGLEVGSMQRGHFERDPNFGDRQVYRLSWTPEHQLDDEERKHAQFVRYLIASGRLTELTEPARR